MIEELIAQLEEKEVATFKLSSGILGVSRSSLAKAIREGRTFLEGCVLNESGYHQAYISAKSQLVIGERLDPAEIDDQLKSALDYKNFMDSLFVSYDELADNITPIDYKGILKGLKAFINFGHLPTIEYDELVNTAPDLSPEKTLKAIKELDNYLKR